MEPDIGTFLPGERVSVTVRCEVPLRDLLLVPIAGSRTYVETASEVLDRYRETG